MLELFANPQFLVAGGALVSAPIIIHLINRMRFKRLRWAAMEFLLKAQKKSRRRLIIEQLILLLLRCLLVALAALLVLRFLGLGLSDLFGTQKENMHIVIIDDTLSMNDRFKDAEGVKTSFEVARKEVLQENILKSLSQSTTNDRLVVLPLSRLAVDPKFKPTVHERLGDKQRFDQAFADFENLKPSLMHVPLVVGVEKAQVLAAANTDKRVTVHVVSDFRQLDWAAPEGRPLHEALLKLVRGKDPVKVRLVDTAHPFRQAGEPNPPAHKNLALVDLRPSTRVTGRGMPVTFTVTVANFGLEETEVQPLIYDSVSGDERLDVTFIERMPLKVPPGETASCSFTLPGFFPPEMKDNEVHYAQLFARLLTAERQPLEGDGLEEDNIRHVVVEVRNKVPVLVVDGRGAEGRKEGGDSYFLKYALDSAPSSSYDVIYADKLEGVADDPRVALESSDLQQYPTILLFNIPSLTSKQVTNLEKYVRQGGGVAFFLGPLVDAVQYNDLLYRDGKGLFPVPLEEKYFPAKGAPELKAEYTGRPQMLLRDDQFPGKNEKIPVFGPIFKEPKLRDFMKHLPVRRYWPALPVAEWKNEPGRVREVINLPNEKPVANTDLAAETMNIVGRLPTEKEDTKAYHSNLKRHAAAIVAAANNPKTLAYQLAGEIESLLSDRGDEPKELGNLKEMWTHSPDPEITRLAKDAESLRRRLLYSHPMMVVGQFGQGRVVAVMTTAGKDWNDWAGGITGSVLYPAITSELQIYLSSQSGDTSLPVGSPIRTEVDRKRWGNNNLTVSRVFYQAEQGKKQVEKEVETGKFRDEEAEDEAKPDAKGNGKDKAKGNGNGKDKDKAEKAPADANLDTFTFRRTLEPGLYVTKLFIAGRENGPPLFTWAHVVNVDTRKESRLARASASDMESALLREAGDAINLPEGPHADIPGLVNRPTDLSESPWLFLFILAILICEQALAVHLSFHLKGSEAELPSQVVNPHATK
jgi:hypothetical protein